MNETVLQLLRDRKDQGSTPGKRGDDARLVLLIEGGSSRGAYSSGMTVAVERLGLLPMFDAVYGSSAGALNAAWLLCGRAESTMHAWWDPGIMGATINPRRVLRGQPVVDTSYLVHTVYTEIMPISAAMPLLAGAPVKIDGRSFVDAGLSEGTPVRSALAQRATHIVALRTRRLDESQSAPSRAERLLMTRWFARHAPGALEPWLHRVEIRAEEERLLASHPSTIQIRPPVGSARIGRTERRPSSLRTAVDTGRLAALAVLASATEVPL